MRDYYYILGINPSASEKEIKSAYRKLSLKFHPDRNDGDKFFEERFKDIQEAYEVLSNPSKKRDYDFRLDQYKASRANVDDLRAYEQELKRRFDAELRKREEEIRRSYRAPVSRNQQETETSAQHRGSAERPPTDERANKKASPRLASVLVALVVVGLIILSSIGIIHRTRMRGTDPNQVAASRNMLPDNSSSGTLPSSSGDSKAEGNPDAADLPITRFEELSQDTSIVRLTSDNAKSFVPADATIDIGMVKLTGTRQPEAVVAYYYYTRADSESFSIPHGGIIVLQYDGATKQWKEIFGQEPDNLDYMFFMGQGSLFNDDREQAIVGRIGGSAAVLYYWIIGTDVNHKVSIIRESDGLFQGSVLIENGSVIEGEASQGKKYIWDGKEFISSPVLINPDVSLAKEGDIIIEYSIDKNDSITANYPNHIVLTTKPGTHIFFIRKNHNGVVERILGPGNIVDYDYTWVTKTFGEGSFSIVPSGYTWEHAFSFEIVCETAH